jgi:hypothetical protein
MALSINFIEDEFSKIAEGDQTSIEKIVESSLLSISGDYNLSCIDTTARADLKEQAQAAYALNVAVRYIIKNHNSVFTSYLKSIVKVQDDCWVFQLCIGTFRIYPTKLVGVVYEELYKSLKQGLYA